MPSTPGLEDGIPGTTPKPKPDNNQRNLVNILGQGSRALGALTAYLEGQRTQNVRNELVVALGDLSREQLLDAMATAQGAVLLNLLRGDMANENVSRLLERYENEKIAAQQQLAATVVGGLALLLLLGGGLYWYLSTRENV